MNTVRSAALDVVRVAGIVAIVVGHVWDSSTIRGSLYTWHVPVFFVLTGYLWTPRRTLRVELAKRTRSLIVPYLAWLLIIALAYLPWLSSRSGGLTLFDAARPFIGGHYTGRPFSAFWFMSALFVAVLVYRSLQTMPFWAHIVVAGAALAGVHIFRQQVVAIPLSAGVAFPCLIFIVGGVGLRRVRGRITHPVIVAIGLLAVCGTAIVLSVSAPLDLKKADFGTPVVSVLVAVAISWSLILLAESAVSGWNSGLQRGFIRLASCGTAVVLSHAVILWVLDTPKNGSWVEFGLSLVVPWSLALAIGRTALAPVLVGAPKISPTGRQPGAGTKDVSEKPPLPEDRCNPKSQ